MIFNKELLFIHNGKTGGSSCAEFLLNHLNGSIYNCGAETKESNIPNIVNVNSINRHCTLRSAEQRLHELFQISLNDFRKIIVCIRHPYTLEVSFYRHMQKPEVREKRKNNSELIRLSDGCFEDFILHAGFHRPGIAQQDYFIVNGIIPSNVELVKYENLAVDFSRSCNEFIKSGDAGDFPHLNKSSAHLADDSLLTERAIRLIRDKHAYMFESGLYSS